MLFLSYPVLWLLTGRKKSYIIPDVHFVYPDEHIVVAYYPIMCLLFPLILLIWAWCFLFLWHYKTVFLESEVHMQYERTISNWFYIYSGAVLQVEWSPDYDTVLASSAADKRLMVWDLYRYVMQDNWNWVYILYGLSMFISWYTCKKTEFFFAHIRCKMTHIQHMSKGFIVYIVENIIFSLSNISKFHA